MSFSFDSKPGESDPTADFLSRERDALQALGGGDDLLSGGGGSGAGVDKTADDFERGASAFPALDGEDDGGFGGSASTPAPAAAPAAPSASRAPTGDLFGGDEDDEQEQEKKRFENNYPAFDDPDLDAPPAPIASQPTAAPASSFSAAAAPAQSTNGFSSNAKAAPSYDDEDDGTEPAPVREWRSKQADEIAARTAAAERKKGEAISRAEREIDTFYEEYNAKKEKTIAKNKENEAAFQAQREKDLAEGTTWQRINKLLDLKDGQSKTIAKPPPGVSDTSRMREIYLNLSKEGSNAPGAAGY